MEEEELFEFLGKRRGLLDGVAITGGEPSLYPELPDFLEKIRLAGFKVKLDTNGLNPDMLERIFNEKLADYVAMDIKNGPSKYAGTAGLEDISMDKVRRSIALIMETAPDYEFRTTVVSKYHSPEDMREIGELIRGAIRYFIQPFRESEGIPEKGLNPPSDTELEEFASVMREYVREVQIRGV